MLRPGISGGAHLVNEGRHTLSDGLGGRMFRCLGCVAW